MKSNYKGIALSLLIFLLMFSLLVSASDAQSQQNSGKKLTLLNWSEYIDPDVLQEFKEKTGISVVEIYFETDEIRNEMLVNAKGSGYDLVLCSGPYIEIYAKRGWLAPLEDTAMANMKHVDPKWRNAFPEAKKFAVPFLWGTLGIGYRSDKIAEPVTSWMDIFRPDPALQNKIVMIKDSREMVGMALKALGYSANSTKSEELEKAKQLLLEQKPFVKTYSYLSLAEDSALATGEALMAMLYNGDALALHEINPAIQFVLPKEGGNIWCDYFVVLRTSQKKEWATQFINFIHQPDIMARLAQYAYFATTNNAAEKLLPQEFLSDPLIYPSPSTLKNSETYTKLPPRTMKKVNSIFNTLIK